MRNTFPLYRKGHYLGWLFLIFSMLITPALVLGMETLPNQFNNNFSIDGVLPKAWYMATNETDAYHLLSESVVENHIAPPLNSSEAINIPLDPERSALNPPVGRWFGRYSLLARDMGYLVVPASVILGLLYIAPESISNWDEEDKDNSLSDLGSKWWDNVSNGPVWDEDDWWLNWIGHPYWGAAYYIHARHYAYSRLESFWYSFFVSNVLYEYGVEAFAEEPSIQDLISTPVGGWLVGEFIFIPLEAKIIANDNTLFGSRVLGKTTRFLMDPLGSIIRPLRRFTHRKRGTRSDNPSAFKQEVPLSIYPMIGENSIGFHFRMTIW